MHRNPATCPDLCTSWRLTPAIRNILFHSRGKLFLLLARFGARMHGSKHQRHKQQHIHKRCLCADTHLQMLTPTWFLKLQDVQEAGGLDAAVARWRRRPGSQHSVAAGA